MAKKKELMSDVWNIQERLQQEKVNMPREIDGSI